MNNVAAHESNTFITYSKVLKENKEKINDNKILTPKFMVVWNNGTRKKSLYIDILFVITRKKNLASTLIIN